MWASNYGGGSGGSGGGGGGGGVGGPNLIFYGYSAALSQG